MSLLVLGEIEFGQDKCLHLQRRRIERARTMVHDNQDWMRNYGEPVYTVGMEGANLSVGKKGVEQEVR
jgi:hypothetical protein